MVINPTPHGETMRFKNQVVWITGGGTGIGFALAQKFSNEGAKVAVSGRRLNKLEEAVKVIEKSGGVAIAVQCDVTNEESVKEAVQKVVARFDRLDVVLANAGFGVAGKIRDLEVDDWRRQFDVNVIGAIATVKHALPHLEKTKGRIGLMGSVSGMFSSPGVGPYHASKFAIRAIGQVLAMELHGSGVSCTTIQPGFVESEIGRVDNAGVFRPEYTDSRPQKLMWSSQKAAKVIVDAIHKRKREFTFTMHGKVVGFFGRHAPSLVHFAVTKFVKTPYKISASSLDTD